MLRNFAVEIILNSISYYMHITYSIIKDFTLTYINDNYSIYDESTVKTNYNKQIYYQNSEIRMVSRDTEVE